MSIIPGVAPSVTISMFAEMPSLCGFVVSSWLTPPTIFLPLWLRASFIKAAHTCTELLIFLTLITSHYRSVLTVDARVMLAFLYKSKICQSFRFHLKVTGRHSQLQMCRFCTKATFGCSFLVFTPSKVCVSSQDLIGDLSLAQLICNPLHYGATQFGVAP